MPFRCPHCGKKLAARELERNRIRSGWGGRRATDPGNGAQPPLENPPGGTVNQAAPQPPKKRRGFLQTLNHGLLALALLITQHQPDTNDHQPDAMATAAAAVDLLLRTRQQQTSDNPLEQPPAAALLQTLLSSAAGALPKPQPNADVVPRAQPASMHTLVPQQPPESR